MGLKHETIHAHTPVRKTTLNHASAGLKKVAHTQGNLPVLTHEEFESAIASGDFIMKWIEKEIGRYKHVELL